MMNKRRLGLTDLKISPIGLGTVKFGRNTDVKYPKPFSLPSENVIRDLLAFAQDMGINLLDTAPAYGDSEAKIGKLLSGSRENWVICSKVGESYQNQQSHFNFDHAFVIASCKNSLRNLKTEYIDILLIHSPGNDVELIEKKEVFAPLQRLKEQGYIRAFGMSTKTVAGGILALQHADVVMTTYNPVMLQEQSVLARAYEMGKGVLIKKALMSGHINKIKTARPIQKIMDFIFNEPAVSSVIVGTVNRDHLAENVKCAVNALNK